MAKTITVVLVGPRAGQDIVLCGIEFKGGKATIQVAKGASADDLLSLLALSHNAHVEGSDEHRAAQKEWDENPRNVANKPRTDELRSRAEAAVKAFAAKNGPDAAVAAIREAGADKLAGVPAAKLPELLERLKV